MALHGLPCHIESSRIWQIHDMGAFIGRIHELGGGWGFRAYRLELVLTDPYSIVPAAHDMPRVESPAHVP